MQVIVFAIPVFLLAIAAEYAGVSGAGAAGLSRQRRRQLADIGILSQISGAFSKLLTIGIYTALVLFSHVALWPLPADQSPGLGRRAGGLRLLLLLEAAHGQVAA